MILRSCFVGGGEKEALRVGAHYGGERQEDEGGAEKTRTLPLLFLDVSFKFLGYRLGFQT